MNYIIHPIWFYLIDIFSKMWFPLFIVIVACIIIIFKTIDAAYNNGREAKIRKPVIIMCIAIFLTFLIPSQKTMYKMMIARFATQDKAQVVLQAIDEKTDKLINAINKDDE